MDGQNPAISVVIPVLDGAATLGAQLDAVLSQGCSAPFEIVVADNGSRDGTTDLVRRYSERDGRVQLVDASVRQGAAGARNVGVEAASAPLVAFCDADDVVAAGWLESIYRGLQGNAVVAVTREFTALNPDLADGGPMVRGIDHYRGVPVVAGGAFGIRRDLCRSVGSFCEEFPAAEDTEFGIRLAPVHRLDAGAGRGRTRARPETPRPQSRACPTARDGPLAPVPGRDAGRQPERGAAIASARGRLAGATHRIGALAGRSCCVAPPRQPPARRSARLVGARPGGSRAGCGGVSRGVPDPDQGPRRVVPLRDLDEVRRWIERESPSIGAQRVARHFLAEIGDEPWRSPSAPIADLSDQPEYEVRVAALGVEGE